MDIPKFYPGISLYVSQILDINGLRKDFRQRRRHLFLKMEVLKTNTDIVAGRRIANYHFGSQTEATTLHHLNSDVDTLYSFIDFDVKQTAEEWMMTRGDQRYRRYQLVINTDNSPPGYVRLQVSWRYVIVRVKSGIFGQTAIFGQTPCLFHSSVIGIKNKLTKQTVKILMRRLIRSRLIWILTVCICVSELI